METTTRHKSQAALAAAAIREILKKAFPGIKFRVVSKNFAGGDDVNVSWTDGPASKTVEAHIKHFQYGNFDGMTDMYEYSNTRKDIPQTKYLFVSRHLSDTVREKWAQEIRVAYGIPATVGINDRLPAEFNWGNDRIADKLWREYEKYDTRSEPKKCDTVGCDIHSRDLRLQADDRALCDRCDYQAAKARKEAEAKKPTLMVLEGGKQ